VQLLHVMTSVAYAAAAARGLIDDVRAAPGGLRTSERVPPRGQLGFPTPAPQTPLRRYLKPS